MPDDEASGGDPRRMSRGVPDKKNFPPPEDELEAAPQLLLCRTGGALDKGRTRTGPCSETLPEDRYMKDLPEKSKNF